MPRAFGHACSGVSTLNRVLARQEKEIIETALDVLKSGGLQAFELGTAGTAILRPHLFVSLEASTRECTVSNSPPECPVTCTHSGSEFHRCPQHRLHPCPKLSVAQPVLFQRADRASANIEVHLTKKIEFRFSRESV